MNEHGVTGALSLTCAAVLGLTAMTCPAVAAAAGGDVALIMGGSGLPIPPQSYVDAADDLYLNPNGFSAYTPQVLITPEQWYPVTGVDSLTLDASIPQGVTILDNAINQQIAAGSNVVVFGYSQSSAVASQEIAQLVSSDNPPKPGQLSFVLVGDPSNPNGGLSQRFKILDSTLSLPGLGETFNLVATPSNAYPTDIYSEEYDAVADFPQYPIDFLAVLNAYLGLFYEHFTYVNLTAQQINSAIALPTLGNTTTHYFMIPTADLPLLNPLRLIPLIGDPLADLLQPDLKILVNLGYGSITNGWSPGPANVSTPFGLFPTNINLVDLIVALANGAVQGVTAALDDLKTPKLFDASSLAGLFAAFHTIGLTPSDNPTPLQMLAAFARLANGDLPVTSTGGVVNTLTSVISDDIAVGLPLAGTVLAIGASLLNYDTQVFTRELRAGHLLNAIAEPIAADFALVPYALVIGAVFPLVEAVASTVTRLAELTGLEPNPSAAKTSGQPVAATKPGTNGTAVPVGAPHPAVQPMTAMTLGHSGVDRRSIIAGALDALHHINSDVFGRSTHSTALHAPLKLTGHVVPHNL